ncbi:MAG: 5'/3'-nucleotidase SurE [Desulfonatronovibrio sp.]
MDILLTNDDGIHAAGIKSLYAQLIKSGHNVQVVAPLTEQSAVGHSVTIFSPIKAKKISDDNFQGMGISGTPVDCVKWAMSFHLTDKPDLVVSGINSGANVGIDVLYSGTVSAATEGALAGIPSLAVSIDDFKPRDLSEQSVWTARLIDNFAWSGLPHRNVLNLNFPGCAMERIKGVKVCSQTNVIYEDSYHCRHDPRGRPYYWLGGEIPMDRVDAGADRALLSQDHITLTPLRFELTNYDALDALENTVRSISDLSLKLG